MRSRRSNRLKTFDYSQSGAYFVTICTENKRHIFGRIADGEMQYSDVGRIAEAEIWNIPKHREYVEVCHAVVMPNHVHMLLYLRRGMTCHAREQMNQFGTPLSHGLGMIIGSYKAAVTRAVRLGMTSHAPTNAVIWQRGYYDHIVRNQADFNRIHTYITENPVKWQEDCYFADQ